MTWLLIAIVGQIMLGTAAVVDKLLLRTRVPDPIVYAFWIGFLGIFSAILLPFGFLHLPFLFILIAVASGAVFMLSLFTLFIILAKTEASLTLPLIAALVPLCTLPFSIALVAAQVNGMDVAGISFLVVGAFIFFLSKRRVLRTHETITRPNLIPICHSRESGNPGLSLHKQGSTQKRVWISAFAGMTESYNGFHFFLLAFASATLYGFSSVLQKIVFEHSNFVTGFFWVKMGEVFCALLLFALPNMRKRILRAHSITTGTNRLWYLANRIWASSGSVLLNAAIFLSHPALVQSTQSFRYMVIFAASWFMLRERSYGKELRLKIAATVFIFLGIVWLGIVDYARNIPIHANRAITWGITFSGKYSRALGVDWQDNFKAIIEELHPKKIRLISYWDHVELTQGNYNFSETDWLLEQLRGKPVEVVFALGLKVPRWPECHVPGWARDLSPEMREEALRTYMSAVITRYRDNLNIKIWQVENEPFLRFGKECPPRAYGFLEKEIALVRQIDHTRPILITDGGEFGRWYKAINAGDIFGNTIYRRVYAPSISRYTGIINYPLSPSFSRFKQKLARWLTGEYAKPFIVIELQGEAWGHVEIPLLPYHEQIALFSPEYFEDTIEFAKQTGFDEYYLWGAEWWYYAREKQSDSRYWDIAEKLLS